MNNMLNKIWDEIFINFQTSTVQSLKLNNDFYPTLYNGYNYIFMLQHHNTTFISVPHEIRNRYLTIIFL